MPAQNIVIHHNPKCGTSRNVLAVIRASGADPVVVEYLKTGWTKPYLQSLFAVAGLTPREALRSNVEPAQTLDDTSTDDQILDAMVAHPVLVNRPIVCSTKGAALCRPADRVIALLNDLPKAPVTKDDGSVIWAPTP